MSLEKRAKIIQLLTEGTSLRATARIVDCSINTVYKLFVDVAAAQMWFQCPSYDDS